MCNNENMRSFRNKTINHVLKYDVGHTPDLHIQASRNSDDMSFDDLSR